MRHFVNGSPNMCVKQTFSPHRFLIAWGLTLCMAGIAPATAGPHRDDPEPQATALDTLSNYQLGPGDRIKIAVYEEKDLTVETALTDAGTIAYPFLGEIRVAGLTVGQLSELIVSRLKGPYLINPKVSISVTQYRSFFIYGEVQKPGSYPYQPGLTVQRAVAIAGGFTERASRRAIMLEKERDPAHVQTRVKLTDSVEPGDVVTVEESFF
jgi:protein involved in polysaccharide export with SLBB domain